MFSKPENPIPRLQHYYSVLTMVPPLAGPGCPLATLLPCAPLFLLRTALWSLMRRRTFMCACKKHVMFARINFEQDRGRQEAKKVS